MNLTKSVLIVNSIDDDDELINMCFSDTNSDSDDGIIDNAGNIILKKRSNYLKRTCIKDYQIVIDNYTENDFIKHFRLDRDVVKHLTAKYKGSSIYQNLIKNENSRAYAITPEKSILVFLWYAGHQTAGFRDVADRFDICIKSLYDIITRVSEFLELLGKHVIKWPSEMEMVASKTYFRERKDFPNVIGCIDSTHIKIDKPTEHQMDYCNRKNYHSIILQGICNEQKKFISIFIGFPGSVHDSRVFKNSTIYGKIDTAGNNFYILGDSGYPLLSNLMTPYRDNGHLSQAQKNFNKKLSSCRVFIEHTFGLLKQRFRQLYHCKLRGHERVCKFIKACCILHNIGSMDDFTIFEDECILPEEQPEETPVRDPTHNQLQAATYIRNQLCAELS